MVNSSGFLMAGSADQWHSARAAVRAAFSVNGIVTQVFSMHLPVVTDARYAAMASFKSWASGFSKPQLVGGDFNADPNQIDISSGMGSAFIDSWSIVGVNAGYTAFTPSPTMKLDYLFGDNTGRVSPLSSSVVTAQGTFSDHFPVIGSFTVRP
jgi:endonuclease/exonuclease/phosphatase family metal-dependent hydrolase